MKDRELITQTELRKIEQFRSMMKMFLKCSPALLFAVAAITLFTFLMTGDFMLAFTKANIADTLGHFLAMVLVVAAVFFGTYFYTENKKYAGRNFVLLAIVITLACIACMTTAKYFSVYAMPIALVTLIVVELLDHRNSMLATGAIAIILVLSYVFVLPSTGEFHVFVMLPEGQAMLPAIIGSVICNTLTAFAINFVINSNFTRVKFILRTLFAAAAAQPMVIFSTMAAGDFSVNILYNMLWSYGAAVAATLLFLPLVAIFEWIFNIADDFRLNELVNLNHPLLKRLASEAPGTFNHSLVVGTIAESCANAIGENPLLARAGAYYHDVGKLKAPLYFAENQSTYNPHDELIPEVSVSMITSHTMFGEILAREYRLPEEIVAICREHHGTSQVGYFYRKALNLTEEGDLPTERYRYSGPVPQSKIAAIVMITDTVEAALRANMPPTKEEFVERVNMLIDEKLKAGQFNECPLTMRDLTRIKETIIEVMPSIHHSRVSYEKRR